jgi:hypothetical protein
VAAVEKLSSKTRKSNQFKHETKSSSKSQIFHLAKNSIFGLYGTKSNKMFSFFLISLSLPKYFEFLVGIKIVGFSWIAVSLFCV